MKSIIIGIIILLAVFAGYKYYTASHNSSVYTNKEYGFKVALPDTWKGYTVVSDTWTGSVYGENGITGEVKGPMVSLRSPLWTKDVPRQDIPVMIFTLTQWNDMQADKFHIGAAPVNPSELGRNSKYVFALPARYNFAYLPGFEEVESILGGKPLSTFEP